MDYNEIIQKLTLNKYTYYSLLRNVTEQEYSWRPTPNQWNLLEILCHLYDEEREDFRARTKHVIETPENPLPSIDPENWVHQRAYSKQDYSDKLKKFIEERENSIQWLQSLESPKWDNDYKHPKFGSMTAKMFFVNWLAHDFLHIRQILKLNFEYLKHISDENLDYAGEW